jgi:hypothetical protein
MWVWTNGKPQFVGEIPAENGNLGHLKISVPDGVIKIEWPVQQPGDEACCPSGVRRKLLTLDGIRLHLLSDKTLANQ